jgi:hypothetical protein
MRGPYSQRDGNRGIEQFLTSDFTAVTSEEGPHFRLEEREAWVERFRGSNTTLPIDDVAVAVLGAVAIATVLATEVADEDGRRSNGCFRRPIRASKTRTRSDASPEGLVAKVDRSARVITRPEVPPPSLICSGATRCCDTSTRLSAAYSRSRGDYFASGTCGPFVCRDRTRTLQRA